MSTPENLFGVLAFSILFVIQMIYADNYIPTVNILLSCGGRPVTSDNYGRRWISDIGSKFVFSTGDSFASAPAFLKPTVPPVPFMNARISTSPFSYSFPVSPGRKFIRLYFYPASYAGLPAYAAVFSVSTGPYSLLKDFSAAQTTQTLNSDYVIKEFSINVPSDSLKVTFTPALTPDDSYAFVNGIEIVSHPDIYNTEDGNYVIAGQTPPLIIDDTTALENLYRLNVGGKTLTPTDDTGLFRWWHTDINYTYGSDSGVAVVGDQSVTIVFPPGTPSYVAPLDVYDTYRAMGPAASINLKFNLTWRFNVDSGFCYLLRLHFCEVSSSITLVNQMVFEIFINNQTAEKGVDLIAWGGTNGVALHRDYVFLVPKSQPQQDLWLALHPNTDSNPQFYNAILNGLEIFKVNDTQGNLGGPNPIPEFMPPLSW